MRAVLDGYTAYWSTLLRASNPPKPADVALAQVATGSELKRARQVLTARTKAGEVARGSYGHAEHVTRLTSNTAMVSDCLSIHVVTYDVRTRKRKLTSPPGPFPVSVSLSRTGGRWKVASVTPGKSSCVAHSTSAPTSSKTG